MQAHLGTDMPLGLHQKVGVSHPRFERAERMLCRASAYSHAFGFTVEPSLQLLQYDFVFPATNATFFARCTF